ncbi:family 43 glycosylhydrolase [Maribellus comscasis]|uniref:Family 43 glycosylhydrolase n=1 Tax=Maribellus comscasis TaxID=2681766 RepID=A0A6I6K554_9BACT|nr:glycosyl hydrolase family 43 [Maribellus comscasis]QGY47552.1 family 43 glycosylhydrolase [Maribellus comscasis]
MKSVSKILTILFIILLSLNCSNDKKGNEIQVPAPLFVDPNYHGSCDPEIVWNEKKQQWYIYYTARRPKLENTWLRTPIGVASSKDLASWQFEGYCRFDGIGGKKDSPETFWAPAINVANDTLHMFVTWKPDTVPIQGAWGGPGWIVHYKTPLDNPVDGWQKVTALHDSTLNTIDATVYKKGELYHVWFKGKKRGASKNELYHKTTSDFYHWKNQGFSESDVFNSAVTGSNFEEAPYIFEWKNKYWLITDPHNGFFVYNSTDGKTWKFQGTILKKGGRRNLDNSMARHCSVAVKDDRTFIFYHVEPWRRYDLEKKSGPEQKRIFQQPLKNRESVLQMAELEMENEKLFCNRNKNISIK